MLKTKTTYSLSERLSSNITEFNQILASSTKEKGEISDKNKQKLEKRIEKIRKEFLLKEKADWLTKEKEYFDTNLLERKNVLEEILKEISLYKNDIDYSFHLYCLFMSNKYKFIDSLQNDQIDIIEEIRKIISIVWKECEDLGLKYMLTWCEKYGVDFVKTQTSFYRPHLFEGPTK